MASSSSTYQYVGGVYSTKANMPVPMDDSNDGSNTGFNYGMHYVCGVSGSAFEQTNFRFTYSGWVTDTATGTPRTNVSNNSFNNLLYAVGGSTGNGTVNVQNPIKYNGTAWASWTAPTWACSQSGISKISPLNLLYLIGGRTDPAGALCDHNRSVNTSDTAAAATASSSVRASFSAAELSGVLYKIGGFTSNAANDASTSTLNSGWNGTAWSTATVTPSAFRAQATAYDKNFVYQAGGANTGGSIIATSYAFNSVSWSTLTNIPSLTRDLTGGVF